MSKLDEKLFEAFGSDLGGSQYDTIKEVAKDLMLELIGENGSPMYANSPINAYFVAAKNELRDELRKKIEEL